MRIRSIKPEFFTHEELFELEKETKLPMRVAFAGLWCACDREGKFKWEPRRLGISILPYDGVDFSRVLDALSTRGFVLKYRVSGVIFGVIPSWKKHQFINNKEKPSDIPNISLAEEVDAPGTRDQRVSIAIHKEGKGKEGKGSHTPLPPKLPEPASPVLGELVETFSDPSKSVDPPIASTKPRNPELDALAAVDGSDPLQIPKGAWGRIAKSLADIKTVTPAVSADEIRRRAANFRLHFPNVASSFTCNGLANHWAKCEHAPAGKEPVKQSEFTNAWGPTK